ncbi:hypothetical protein [Haliangium sp.]|uniref:hypothetical protein n=1 Tax=Haliangium sp. TaxID=2663208 RepID=UPI003D0EB10A
MRICFLVGLLAVAVASASGCKREAPVNGIGGFEIDKTQLGSLSGRCIDASEEPLMLCPSIASVMLGEQRANIDLYFGGKEADDTLVEILLDVGGCRPEALEAFLSERLGEPVARTESRVLWQNDYILMSAAVPAGPSRCEVNFVSIHDRERVQRLGGTPPETAAE